MWDFWRMPWGRDGGHWDLSVLTWLHYLSQWTLFGKSSLHHLDVHVTDIRSPEDVKVLMSKRLVYFSNSLLRKISFFLYPQVQLKDIFEYLPGKMNTELAESGLNLSVGQKQLVCLARTILKKSQILIIDKATSNVDPRYGAEIQETLNLSSWILKVVNWKHILLASWIFLDNINSRKQRIKPRHAIWCQCCYEAS